ncbi:MAG: ABC transporter permease [Clostridium sp.]|nr:ABC transporter permease [Clostridium sp.]MCM1399955.1 ABC transporter permease [Clostridium sp.]MCM1460304.1 ABC transporter permease [Bacteroides sp.]
MFFHNFKYCVKATLRNKPQMLWSVVFIIALGTLFFVSFDEMYNQELADAIKVAVMIEDDALADSFLDMAETISLDEESGEKLLDIACANDMDAAKAMLEEKDIEGIFYAEDGEIKLMIHENGINQSILGSIVTKYHQVKTVIEDLSQKAPDQIPIVLSGLLLGESNNTEKKNTTGDMDMYIAYFYNLIALACLMAVTAGIRITAKSQANLSAVGARKCVANAGTFLQTLAELLAGIVVQCLCTLVGFLYLIILGVDFGNQIGQIALIIIVGCIAGISFGFFIGNIGKGSMSLKENIGTAVILVSGFLSGLMVGNMRIKVEETCPVINKINPSALISDSFYALNIYDTYDRYYQNLITLFIMSVVCIILGALLGRRKKYASI